MNVHEMLLAYQTINETRLTKVHLLGDENFSPIKQLIAPPDAELPSKVPTLQPEHYRKITPFLKARFEYAGAWKEADAGHEWLGLKQMETVLLEASVLEQIRARSEIWSDSPLVQMPPSRISLFGLYRDQAEEIYLIWPAVDGDEPEILSYGGNYESMFSDFAQYLNYLIEG